MGGLRGEGVLNAHLGDNGGAGGDGDSNNGAGLVGASMKQTNQIVSTVMAAATQTLRYPGYTNNDLSSIIAPLIPSPKAHFLMTSYTPFTSPSSSSSSQQTTSSGVRKTSVLDVMRRLLQPQNRLANVSTSSSSAANKLHQPCYISILNIISSSSTSEAIDPSEVHKSLLRIRERQLAPFIPWGPASISVSLTKRSPYISSSNKVSGLLLANHTGMAGLFRRILDQYERMRKRNAYLDAYRKEEMFKDGLGEFDESKEEVLGVVREYEEMNRPEWAGLPSED